MDFRTVVPTFGPKSPRLPWGSFVASPGHPFWGVPAGIMGIKSQHVTQRRERAIQAEKAKKLGLQLA